MDIKHLKIHSFPGMPCDDHVSDGAELCGFWQILAEFDMGKGFFL